MKKIRKKVQSIGVVGKILNAFSNSDKDAYSCDYLNKGLMSDNEKEKLSEIGYKDISSLVTVKNVDNTNHTISYSLGNYITSSVDKNKTGVYILSGYIGDHGSTPFSAILLYGYGLKLIGYVGANISKVTVSQTDITFAVVSTITLSNTTNHLKVTHLR